MALKAAGFYIACLHTDSMLNLHSKMEHRELHPAADDHIFQQPTGNAIWMSGCLAHIMKLEDVSMLPLPCFAVIYNQEVDM